MSICLGIVFISTTSTVDSEPEKPAQSPDLQSPQNTPPASPKLSSKSGKNTPCALEAEELNDAQKYYNYMRVQLINDPSSDINSLALALSKDNLEQARRRMKTCQRQAREKDFDRIKCAIDLDCKENSPCQLEKRQAEKACRDYSLLLDRWVDKTEGEYVTVNIPDPRTGHATTTYWDPPESARIGNMIREYELALKSIDEHQDTDPSIKFTNDRMKRMIHRLKRVQARASELKKQYEKLVKEHNQCVKSEGGCKDPARATSEERIDTQCDFWPVEITGPGTNGLAGLPRSFPLPPGVEAATKFPATRGDLYNVGLSGDWRATIALVINTLVERDIRILKDKEEHDPRFNKTWVNLLFEIDGYCSWVSISAKGSSQTMMTIGIEKHHGSH